MKIQFDDQKFNNIVTPIAAIVSVALFILISLRQESWIKRQNNKTHIERSIERVRKTLEKDFEYPLLPDGKACNGFNFMNYIKDYHWQVKENIEYQEDAIAFGRGTKYDQSYYTHRSYSKSLNFLTSFNYINFHYCPTKDLKGRLV